MEKTTKNSGMGIFERYLTVWVALCIIIGIAVGKWLPAIPQTLGQWEYANVSIPVAILIWLMIYPMMLKVDFQSVKKCRASTQRHRYNLHHQLDNQAFDDVWNCLAVLLRGFQASDSS